MSRTSRSAIAVAALGGLALQPLYAAGVRAMLQHSARRLREGDIEPTLRAYHEDVVMRFPGESSWSGEFHGKDAVEEWLLRFRSAGIQIVFDDILVSGPPWHTKVCMRFTDYATDEHGETVYVNEGTIVAHVRWGKVYEYETFEDTEKSAAFDTYLASRGI
ncbi:nuclear transport factor 2 family protein [Streptomyces boninensis]|uniref:nuclear transport factor 2 family protein n=1 Tax=Streptomyces boninensis TaxID=2039455 RepID=UPI003B210AF1